MPRLITRECVLQKKGKDKNIIGCIATIPDIIVMLILADVPCKLNQILKERLF
jgi:hypothetical protein